MFLVTKDADGEVPPNKSSLAKNQLIRMMRDDKTEIIETRLFFFIFSRKPEFNRFYLNYINADFRTI